MSDVRYLSVKETAKKTGISEYFIRKHVALNNIPGCYSGKKFMVDVPMFIARLEVLENPNPPMVKQDAEPAPKKSKKKDEPTLRDILKTELRDIVREELRNIVREELRGILIEELR